MIIVKLSGGLGNQLNCYSVGKYICSKHNVAVRYDISSINKDWQSVLYLDKVIPNLEFIDSSNSNYDNYERITFNIKDGFEFYPDRDYIIHTVEGHPYEYIKHCSEIRTEISIENILTNINDLQILKEINISNSVAIHVRRGDYINVLDTKDKFGILTIEYYKNAIDIINSKLENPFFYFFSDDTLWVEQKFSYLKNKIIVKHNKSRINSPYDSFKLIRFLKLKLKYFSRNRLSNALYDFILMKNCKHFITANSTYSWWAAYLGNNSDKTVICPYQWSKFRTSENTVPKEWIKI